MPRSDRSFPSRVPTSSGRLAAAVALLLTMGACDSPSKPVPVASVVVTAPSATMVIGTAQQLTAQPRDGQGNALTGRVVTWQSRNTAVAVVSAEGTVAATAIGTAMIEATSEGQSGSVTITVTPVPVASVSITGAPSGPLPVGGTVQLTATPRDAAGNALSGRPLVWSTTNSAIAAVSTGGLVTGVSTGSVTITAGSEGREGSVQVSVEAIPPTVTGVSPATVAPNALLTISGAGFSAIAANNAVSVGGVPVSIVTAAPNQLQVSVPCLPSGPAEVRVTTSGSQPATSTVTVNTPQRTVAVGEALIIPAASASLCNELTAAGGPARYLVTVFSTATSPNTVASFELAGNPPAAGTAARVVRAPAAAFAAAGVQPVVDPLVESHDRTHLARLERNRLDYERLMAEVRAQPAAVRERELAASRAASRAYRDPTVGDVRSLYYNFNGCNDSTQVMRVRAIRVGTKSVIWEDSANVLQSSANAALAGYYERIGQIYDQEQHESVARTFADPLVRDAVTDNDGRIQMVFTSRLNGSGAAAYVTSCDLFARGSGRFGSNFGEYFYGFVPTADGTNLESTANPAGWFNFMVRTVVHEVKHIASLSSRVANNAPQFEQSWLEEGTARHAEEVWVRESLHQVPWKGNTGFGTASTNGIFCDFHPADATCAAADPLRRPGFGMRRHFNEIREKLLQPWNWSPFGDGTGQSGAVFYQTAWSLVRYAIDRYATSDAAFLTALTNATTSGTTNLTAVAGASLDQLIGGWGLALFADDYPGLAAPSADIQFPTWNLRNIYAGLNASPNWQNRFPTAFPIAPAQLGFGSFTSPVTGLRGGAHAYFEMAGPHTVPQLLSLRGPDGTAASTNLRLAITRLQ